MTEFSNSSAAKLLDQYLKEFDDRFDFFLRNEIDSKQNYKEAKLFFVFKRLAIHYNFSIPA